MAHWRILLLSAVLGCSYAQDRNAVTGWITPDYFVFQELVPLGGEEAGGWRAACVRATIRDGESGAKVICEIEVGIPIKTQAEGWISVVTSRELAAITANQAAYTVLSKRGAEIMLGPACIEFQKLFTEVFENRIPQSRVRRKCAAQLQPVVFDVIH